VETVLSPAKNLSHFHATKNNSTHLTSAPWKGKNKSGCISRDCIVILDNQLALPDLTFFLPSVSNTHKGLFALGKDFTECYTRQRKTLDKLRIVKNPKNNKNFFLFRGTTPNHHHCHVHRPIIFTILNWIYTFCGRWDSNSQHRILLYNPLPISLVSILRFSSPHIITNQE
jgi:hypothetical protein